MQHYRTACQCVIFGISSPQRHYIDNLFQLFVLIIQGISAFCLSLALNHQYRYRSTSKEDPFINPYVTGQHEARVYQPSSGSTHNSSSRSPTETQSLLRNGGSINSTEVSKLIFLKRALLSPETLYFFLFVAYLVGLYLKVAYVTSKVNIFRFWTVPDAPNGAETQAHSDQVLFTGSSLASIFCSASLLLYLLSWLF